MAVIENQRITKRRTSGSRRPNKKKPADYNSVISGRYSSAGQYRPNSAYSRRKKHNGLHLFSRIRAALFPQENRYDAAVSYEAAASCTETNRERELPHRSRHKKCKGFSFSIPPLAALAAGAGFAVIAFAALNWENFEIKTPDIYAFQPVINTEASQERIFQYASSGFPEIMGGSVEPQALAPTGDAGDAGDENPRGMLITFEWRQYRVQRGDSVSAIAQKHNVSVGAVIASNNISNARRLQEGAVLRIPNIDGIPHQIKRGDSLSRISAAYNVPLDVILDVNDIKNDNIKPGDTLFIPGGRMNDIDLRMSLGDLFMFPLPGRRYITSNYGMRRDPISRVPQFHNGVDFRANTGTTVMAALDGVVAVVSENWLYGKYIIITHSNGYKTLYGHLNSFSVKQGDRVARGRKIGESGNTGYSTGPHLHFGIYDRGNNTINPLELIN